MSKSRKILSVVLAIAMLCSIFAVSAFAAEDTQTWALASVDNGATVTVKVSLTTNYKTGAIEFAIKNTNKTGVAFNDCDLGAAVPAYFNADITAKEAADGTVKVVIVPSTNGMADTVEGSVINGVVAELTYNVTTGATATLTLDTDDAKTDTNLDGTLIALRQDKLTSGSLVYGQTVTNTSAPTVSIGAADPELKVIAGTIGVIDTTRTEALDATGATATVDGFIYGVEPEYTETVESVFEVENGTMEIVANEVGSECGTGTFVNVKNAGGTVVATYCLIIFGDVTGDGAVNGDDTNIMELADAYMLETDTMNLEYSPAYQFAGDLNADGSVSGDDSNIVDLHDAYMYVDGTDGMRFYQSQAIELL